VIHAAALPVGLPDLATSGVGALVLGGDHQGLGVVRSLGRRGVPVHVVDDEVAIARFSRWTTATHTCDLASAEVLVPFLLALGREHRLSGWVLYPTRDETVEVLARHRDELTSSFRVPTPAWPTARIALDKRLTYRTAQSLGIATPRTWYLSSPRDVELVDGEPPYAVKPAIKAEFVRVTRAKAWRADSRDELARLVACAAQVVPADEVMVQEVVPGDGQHQLSYCGLLRDGEPLASMLVRRLRQHPHEFGRATTYARTVDDPETAAVAEALLRHLRWSGLVEVEFKHDVRDGRTKLLDVNARTWGHHTLGQAAGVDFPSLLMADQLGLAFDRPTARTGVSWVRLVTDLPAVASGLRHRRWGPREVATSLREASVESVFVKDDPLPGLVELALVPYLAATRGW